MPDLAKHSGKAPSKLLKQGLLESDRRYFESAACIEDCRGATIARIPGHTSLPAACVVQRITPSDLPVSTQKWLDRIETYLDGMGYSRARLYLRSRDSTFATELVRRGYDSSEEIGFLRIPPAEVSPSDECRLEPISDAEDWALKLRLHERCDVGPDGYPSTAKAWVDMERRRVEAGYMEPFFIKTHGSVRGVLSLAEFPHLLRLKNLVIHPDFRGEGVGTTAVQRVLREARKRRKRAVGAFGVKGSPGASLYRSCGFEEAVAQTEWARKLSGADDPALM